MIRVITGNPGAGKTLRGVEFLVKAKAEGRPIYAHGINELSPELGVLDCNPREWQSLPDGSIIVVDEAQNVWPSGRRTEPPDDIRAMSLHRHRGFDFVLLTQNPGFIDKYVRDLCGEHEHVFRQFGTGLAKIVTWPGVVDEPRQPSAMARGTESYWKYNKKLYTLYKSSTMHTVKTKIPMRLKLIPVFLLAVVALAFFAYRSLHQVVAPPSFAPSTESASSPATGVAGFMPGQKSAKGYATAEDYVIAQIPRVVSDPGSSPIFDGREAVSSPELYCASREDGYCVCLTEQGTKYHIERRDCLVIALNGRYNPFRREREDVRETRQSTQTTLPPQPVYVERPAVTNRPRQVDPPQTSPFASSTHSR